MTKNEELKHAEDIFDALTESYLMHYGVSGMEWYKNKAERYQSQAQYARFIPKPNGKVRGQNEVNAAKKRMAIQNETLPGVPSDLLRKRYPSQKLPDLNRLDGKPTFETRREINHPSNEKGNEAGRHYNCPNCATAFEMQERGYDVIARPAKNGSNVGDIESNFENGKLRSVSGQIDLTKLSDLYKNMQNTEKRYKNTSFNNVKKRIDNAIEARKAFDDYYTELNDRRSEAANNAIRSIQSQGKNARGIVVVGWAQYENPSRRTSLYHAFNYKNENGELKFYDTQSNHDGAIKGYSADDAKKAIFPDIDPREIYVMRTDGINVTENVTNSVYSPTRKNNVLQHAESVFDALTESYLMHIGVPGMEWYKNKAERYQPQAQYARFIPNPNGRVRGQKEKSEKVNVLTKNDFHNLPQREQIRIQTNSLAGKNYEFNKKMRASLQNEKDGTGGRIDTVSARYGPMQLHWEKSDGRVTFREAVFNRKVSDKYADKMLNQAMFGVYTRRSGVPDAAILNVGKTSNSRRKT